MARYILVDSSNLFFRCRHATQGDAFTKVGMTLHILFRSIRKVWRDFAADHIVFALDGGSWRRDVYPPRVEVLEAAMSAALPNEMPPGETLEGNWREGMYPTYKAHRRLLRLEQTPREQEEEEVFRAAHDDFNNFVAEKTRSTVLHSPGVEADDFIARWIQLHPEDEHVILSGDSDFVQLLAPNVTIYDGLKDHTISTTGIKDAKGRNLEFSIKSDSKLKIGKPDATFVPEPNWWQRALFTKIVRGDSGDNIFSAYPKVREPKLRAAYEDREQKGYNWNNFMLQTWTDHDGKEVRVLDRFRLNESLIDLTRQPEHVKQLMDTVIVQAVQKEPVQNVGIAFLRFCKQHALENLSREAADHATYLNAPYKRG